MKAWELRQSQLRLHDVERPGPGTDDAAVQVTYAGICGSDLPKLLRPNDFALPEPWRPGHEIVGTNDSGDPVAVDPLVPCGQCETCRSGDIHLCLRLRRLGWDLPGGFAERVWAPAANLHTIPDELDPFHAVLADPSAVAIHGIRCGLAGPAARLAVVGAGTLGLLTALYASNEGWTVTVVHRDERPPNPAVTGAIPATFRPTTRIVDGDRFDAVVDAATGDSTAPLELALNLVSDGGTIVVQNAYHPGVCLPVPLRDVFRRSIRLVGSFSYCRRGGDDFAEGLRLLARRGTAVQHLVARAGNLPELVQVSYRQPARSTRSVLTVQIP
jgi:threonine dehydrogenase-like Zn-dependent dehydrogenase